MNKRIIESVDDFLNLSGEVLGESEWICVSQDVINHFADATFDHQWIHVDSERAKKESPYNTTIAHGYLTLSLIPHFLDEIIDVRNVRQILNYGIENLNFKEVVPVNSRVRMKVSLKSVNDFGSMCKTTYLCCFEIEGNPKPVVEGSIVFLYLF